MTAVLPGRPKKNIDLLKTHPLGLLHEEEREDTHGKTEDGEDDERLPTDSVDDLRRYAGDYEVE